MTVTLERTLYTATATVVGGREGRGTSDDGALEVELRMPKELGGPGGGTNPEQLFAVGYAACFQSSLGVIARQEGLSMEESSIRAQVSVGPVPGGAFGLAVVLEVALPGMEPDVARRVTEAAHAVCPYSNAVRANVAVELRNV